MLGTACPKCGQYFRKGYREVAAEHLMDHEQGRRMVPPGHFEFHLRLSMLVFTGGVTALVSSLLSA